jgi:enoyl-[acyl-carrier protein] reductase III
MALAGKTALVTGGTRGIGRATALALAHAGADVAVNYFRSREDARTVVAEVEALGRRAVAARANVGNAEQLDKMVAEVRDAFGGHVDIVVSNAALGVPSSALAIDQKAWDIALGTNAWAFAELVKRVAPLMREGGRIFTLSSFGATRAIDAYAAIGASKAALESLTRSVAYELAPRGITANIIRAGFVDTDALRQFPNRGEMEEANRARTPMGRIGRAEDVADAIALLCEDGARWITGQTIVVDGGWSLT